MLPEIKQRIISTWPQIQQEGPPSSQIHFVRLGSLASVQNEGAATFLCFVGLESRPRFVLKVAKEPIFSNGIRQEYANLAKASKMLGSHGFARIPTALDLFELDGRAMLVESYLKGRHFLSEVQSRGCCLHRRRVAKEMALVVRWVSEFGHVIPEQTHTLSAEYLSEIGGAFRSRFKVRKSEEQLLDLLTEEVKNSLLPLFPAHGDFFAGNLLSTGGTLAVYDWTFFQERAVPLFDFVHFAISRPSIGANRGWCAEMALVMESPSAASCWYTRMLGRCAARIRRNLGLDGCSLRVLWGLALLAGTAKDWSLLGARVVAANCFRHHFGALADLCK